MTPERWIVAAPAITCKMAKVESKIVCENTDATTLRYTLSYTHVTVTSMDYPHLPALRPCVYLIM